MTRDFHAVGTIDGAERTGSLIHSHPRHKSKSRDQQSCETVLFDLDDCLYYHPEMSQQVAKNIKNYMVEFLDVPASEVDAVSRELYQNHGTTLAGLVNVLGKDIDYDHWHSYVHWSLDYESYLKPDAQLKAMIQGMPVKKYVFTNADRKHALMCLHLLGLADCFNVQDIICFETMLDMSRNASVEGIVCKPQPLAFELVMERIGGEVGGTVFFDDSARNIAAAHTLGIYSVLVNPNRIDSLYDWHVKSIHDVPFALPWLTGVTDGKDHSLSLAEELAAKGVEETPVIVRA